MVAKLIPPEPRVTVKILNPQIFGQKKIPTISDEDFLTSIIV
jgi:hypothetical protein